MLMPNAKAGASPTKGEPLTETQASLRGAFGDLYRFILQAVKGDKAAADAIFEDYLGGKLSEELLSLSRNWVSADQAGSCGRNIEELIAGEGRSEVGGDHRPFAHFGLFNGHAAPTSLPNDIVSRSVDQQHGNVNRTLSDPTGPPKRLRRAATPPRAGGEGSSLGSI
jgi:hypothetical protein